METEVSELIKQLSSDEGLRSFNKLDVPERTELLRKTDPNGRNALMLVASSHAEYTIPTLKALEQLQEPAFMKTILEQTDNHSRNALMLAIFHRHPMSTDFILKALMQLRDPELMKTILGQTDNQTHGALMRGYGHNALMLAALRDPNAVALILEAVAKLEDPAFTKDILSRTDNYGDDALLLAAHHKPEAAVPILETLAHLQDPAFTKAILSQTNHFGKNTLMMAIRRYNPEVVAPIIEAVAKLNLENLESFDSLLEGMEKEELFQAIKTLPEPRQIDLLEKALKPDNILGRKMWTPRIVGTECSLERGTLKAIHEHLIKLRPEGPTTTSEDVVQSSEVSASDGFEYPENSDDIPLRTKGATTKAMRIQGITSALASAAKDSNNKKALPLHEAINTTIEAVQSITLTDPKLTERAVDALHLLQELLLNHIESSGEADDTISQTINLLQEDLRTIDAAVKDSNSWPKFSVFSTDTSPALFMSQIQTAWKAFQEERNEQDSDDENNLTY